MLALGVLFVCLYGSLIKLNKHHVPRVSYFLIHSMNTYVDALTQSWFYNKNSNHHDKRLDEKIADPLWLYSMVKSTFITHKLYIFIDCW